MYHISLKIMLDIKFIIKNFLHSRINIHDSINFFFFKIDFAQHYNILLIDMESLI